MMRTGWRRRFRSTLSSGYGGPGSSAGCVGREHGICGVACLRGLRRSGVWRGGGPAAPPADESRFLRGPVKGPLRQPDPSAGGSLTARHHASRPTSFAADVGAKLNEASRISHPCQRASLGLSFVGWVMALRTHRCATSPGLRRCVASGFRPRHGGSGGPRPTLRKTSLRTRSCPNTRARGDGKSKEPQCYRARSCPAQEVWRDRRGGVGRECGRCKKRVEGRPHGGPRRRAPPQMPCSRPTTPVASAKPP